MILGAVIIGALATAILLSIVSVTIRQHVFNDRRDAILSNAQQRIVAAQAALATTTASTSEEVSAAVQAELSGISDSASGAGAIGAVVQGSGESSSVSINTLSTDDRLTSLISDRMEREVRNGQTGRQYWQSVTVPGERAGTVPGMVVGSRVSLPLAGDYELYIVYSLESQQQVVDTVTRSVVLTGVGFLLIIILAVAIFTWRVLIPVRRTSLAAKRLAEGRLDEPLAVNGEDELAALATSFNMMAESIQFQIDRLNAMSVSQQLFVSDVSHELRTPLTTIKMAAEHIFEGREEIEDPLVRRAAVLLHGQVDRFQTMLTDLLEISRIDSGRVTLRADMVDLRDLLSSVLEDNEVHIQASGCEIRLQVPDEDATAEVDSVRVQRILRNLILNAIEHAESEPIDITMAVSDDAVAVRVRDHGVGMSPDVVGRVFDRFYRADPSRKRTLGGTGLGLSISAEDAHLHGGSLQAWGWPADGASFLLTLPRELGEGGAPGRYAEPGPLPCVPDDAPAVARVKPRRAPEAVGGTVLGPGPVSRRSARAHGDEETPLAAADAPAAPGHVTVIAPGQAPTARTPEVSGGRAS